MNRRLVGCGFGLVATLFVPVPAAAQDARRDVSAGYSLIRCVDCGTSWTGVNVSIADGGDRRVSGVGDFSGYINDTVLWAQVGARFRPRRSATVVPFGQIVGGIAVYSGLYLAWTIQPGAGVDLRAKPGGPGVRIQADFPILIDANYGDRYAGFRLAVGIVVGR